MGLEALTRARDGTLRVPEKAQDWGQWVSATHTRNYALDDPILDWLDLFGEAKGFPRDDQLPGYDSRTDFSKFIMRKGEEFEEAVIAYLSTLAPVHTIARSPAQSRDLASAQKTFEAMASGQPIIYQAALRDAESMTYGVPDLLVRSDWLRRLFPTAISLEEANVPASDLGDAHWHYRVVDIKYTTLDFLSSGSLSDSSGSTWAYKLQLYIYNRALGSLQGYTPPESYLLGRGWRQVHKGQEMRGTSCMGRLGAVPQEHRSRAKGPLSEAVEEACAWMRRVRREGRDWEVLPEPSIPELRPNMGSSSDQPWHHAKQEIGWKLEELTLLWQVGVSKRREANGRGIYRWTDPDCASESLGVTGKTQAPILDAILQVNRSNEGPSVRPDRIHSAEAEWRKEPSLELYVDFEWVNDLNDDFGQVPERGGQPLIFMIGCGHLEAGEWRWACFVADALTPECEAQIIDSWFQHMARIKDGIDPSGPEPRVFHWSHAEQSILESAFNSAKSRHPQKRWPDPRWFDFLKQVIKAEPVVIRGALDFGLKTFASAMCHHRNIETRWDAGPTDGMGAMVGAWWCASEATRRGCALQDVSLMQEIARYNEVDCKVMMEIVRYLRGRH